MQEFVKRPNSRPPSLLVYGDVGVGKTPLVAHLALSDLFAPAILVDLDGGTLSITHLPVSVIHIRDVAHARHVSEWMAFLQVARWVADTRPAKTIILDSLTWAEIYCERATTAEAGHSLASLADYRAITERFVRALTDLMACAIVVATAHERVVQDDATGIKTITPAFLGRGTYRIPSLFDIVARMTRNPEPTLTFAYSKGVRFMARDRTATLPDTLTAKNLADMGGRLVAYLTRKGGQ